MKAYTDLEQSKKLAEILPIESADMYYPATYIDKDGNAKYNTPPRYLQKHVAVYKTDIHCWSLAALLDILTEQDYTIKAAGNEFNIDIPIRHCKIWFSSLLDAAFEMILFLKESDLL